MAIGRIGLREVVAVVVVVIFVSSNDAVMTSSRRRTTNENRSNETVSLILYHYQKVKRYITARFAYIHSKKSSQRYFISRFPILSSGSSILVAISFSKLFIKITINYI